MDIGYQNTTLSVFENGSPVSIQSFSIGSCDITNDIALGFKVSLEEAERLKLGNPSLERTSGTQEYSKKKLDEIIEARLSDIFELVENHLKKIKRNGLLPAGVLFVGGGAGIPLLANFSKSVLKLPSEIGTTEIFGNSKTKLRDPAWFNALGLLISGKDNNGYSGGSFMNLFKDIKSALKSSVKQLMP